MAVGVCVIHSLDRVRIRLNVSPDRNDDCVRSECGKNFLSVGIGCSVVACLHHFHFLHYLSDRSLDVLVTVARASVVLDVSSAEIVEQTIFYGHYATEGVFGREGTFLV